jgi:enoyl-CoA hydratase/carnithine racemase
VQYILHELPSRNITTIAALRGNAAAGGVAMATACDFVIAGSDVVLNPAYRGIGLYGSEYHTISYFARCGEAKAKKLLSAMLPISPLQARQIGLVDFVFPGSGDVLDDHIQTHVSMMALREKVYGSTTPTSPNPRWQWREQMNWRR